MVELGLPYKQYPIATRTVRNSYMYSISRPDTVYTTCSLWCTCTVQGTSTYQIRVPVDPTELSSKMWYSLCPGIQ